MAHLFRFSLFFSLFFQCGIVNFWSKVMSKMALVRVRKYFFPGLRIQPKIIAQLKKTNNLQQAIMTSTYQQAGRQACHLPT